MKTAVRLVALGMLISACFTGPAAAQYIKILTDNPTDNTRLRATGTTILSITLDTNHDKDGSLQTCNSHSAANCGATPDTAPLDLLTYQIYLTAVGGTVQWGTFTPDSSTFQTLLPQRSNSTDVEFTFARQPPGSASPAGFNSLGKIPVTILTGSPSITFPRYPNLPLDPDAFGSSFGPHCPGFAFASSYVLGDRSDPCGAVSGIPTDWYDSDGVGPSGGSTNQMPSIAAPTSASATEGVAIATITATATDADAANNLTITQSGKPASLTFTAQAAGPSPRTATITGTPGFSDAGSYTIVWTVNDGSGATNATASTNTVLTIVNANQTPAITAPATASGTEGVAIATITATATDADGAANNLTITQVGKPASLTFTAQAAGPSPRTATITGTPASGSAGSYTIVWTVNDGTGAANATASTNTVLTIAAPANTRPAITAPATASGSEGVAIATITASATDADAADNLTITQAGKPASLTFTAQAAGPSPRTATITGAPAAGSAGSYSIVFTVNDGTGATNATASTNTVLTIANVNQTPAISAPATSSGTEGAAIGTITATATDADAADNLAITQSGKPADLTFTATPPGPSPRTATISGTPGFSDAGSYNIAWTVNDGAGGTATVNTALDIANTNQAPTLNQPANMTLDENATADQVITGADADGDALTFAKVDGPTYMTVTTTNATTGNIHLAPGFSNSGTAPATVRASDGSLNSDKTLSITVNNVNRPPALAQPSNMTVDENATADQVLTASDPDADALTFTKVAGPAFMSVTSTNATTGNVHLAPGFSDSGTAPATVRASDGLLNSDKTLTITVNNVNRPPTLVQPSNMTVTEGGTADQTLTGSDPDGDALTFTKATGPGFMTVATTIPLTGNVHLAPIAGDAAGSPYAASATASDATLSDTKSFSITVNPGVPQNRAPTLDQPSNMTVDENATADQVLTASDPDADALTFTKLAGPAFMTVTTTNATTGNVHLAPGFTDAGTQGATVRASDGSLSDDKSFTITVTNVNRGPTLAQPSNMTVNENATADQVLTGSDPDADALTFTKVTGPAFMSVTTTNATTGNVHLAPAFSDSGTFSAAVRASDGSLSDDKSLQIRVNNVNRPPTLVQPANMTVTEGGTADQTLTASDPDGDALVFQMDTGAPAFMTVTTTTPTTGNVHLAPIVGDAAGSPYSATVRAVDVTSSDAKSFSITVNPTTPGNRPPTLAQPSNMTVDENATADQVLTASDPDADALTFTKLAGPAFMNVSTTNATTGNVHLAPSFSDSGRASAVVRASDGSLSDDKSLTITVNNVNRPPTLVQPSDMTVTEGSTADQTLTGSDPDGDALTFTKATGPGFMAVTTTTPTTGNIHLAPIAGDATSSPYAASAMASDGSLSDTKSFSITVSPVGPGNRAPTLAPPTDMRVDEGGTADQVLTGSDPDEDPLTFTKVAGPGFMTVTTTNATTGNIHLAPGFSDAGIYPPTSYPATVRASDGSLSDDKSLTISVNNVNRPPTLVQPSDMTVTEGGTADQALTGFDPDGEALTFTKATGPGFMTVTTTTPTTGNVHLAPIVGDVGTHEASATASDGTLSDTKSFTITVSPGSVDRAPAVAAPSAINGEEGGVIAFSVSASDPDGDAIASFTAEFSLPEGNDASFTTDVSKTTGNFVWHPKSGDAGSYSVTFTASNGLSGSATTQLGVDRAGTGVNGLFTWTPQAGAEGVYDIVFTATDAGGTSTFTSTITIVGGSASPHPASALAPQAPQKGPIISGPSTVSGTTGTEVTVSVYATSDPTTGAAAASPRVRLVSRAARAVQAIDLTADLSNLPAGNNAQFNIIAGQTNASPTLTQPSNMTVDEGATADQVLSGSDPDGDALTFTKADGPGFMTVTTTNATTGNVHLAPGFSDAGAYGATVRASDAALSDEKSFQITVNDVEGAFEADVSVSDGDRVIRLATGRPFWCVQIEPVGGNFSINDIIPSSIVASFGGVEIPILAARKFGCKGKDHDRDIRSDGVRNGNNSREEGGDSAFRACFSKESLRILFASLPDGRQTVEVTIAGNLTGGGAFEGTVSVIVVKGALGALAHANATPNPFNPQTVINFELSRPGSVKLQVFDVSGRLVNTLADEVMSGGPHGVPWNGTSRDGSRVSSGVYFYVLQTPDGMTRNQLVVVK